MNILNRERLSLLAGAAVAAALTAGTLIASTANADAAKIGRAAPAFTELTTAGDQIANADLAGKTVVLEWTNHGCPFVQKHYSSGNMQATQQAAVDAGVVWISVVSSRPGSQGYVTAKEADALTATREAHPTYVVLDADGSMGRAYGATATPHMFVIGPDGNLAYNGAIDSIASAKVSDISAATNYVTAALAALSDGKEPNPSLTPPYGCSVKY